MMIKKKSNPWARLKYLYVLPLAAVAVAAFARPEVSNKLNEISSVKVNDLTSIVKTEEVKSVENFSDEKFVLNGQVMDHSSKKPVPGASIIIRGTTIGTLSDEDGKFSLDVKKGDVIVVSYIGLQTQQLPIEGAGNLVVWMSDDVQPMEEMTVVGYASDGEGTPDGKGRKVETVVGIPEVKIKEVKVDETEQSTSDAIFQVVEEAPEFPGGMQACMVFLAKNIKYPVEAQKAGTEGRVIVQFVVGRDGSIRNPKVVRGVSPELDAEAIRVVSMMPKWNPGKQRGKAVAVNFALPIMFRLSTLEPKKEEMPHTLQVNLTVDKDASQKDVEAVKSYLRDGYEELQMNLNDESVEQLPSGGVRYKNKSKVTMHVEDGKYPLIIIDGKEFGRGTDLLKNVPVDQIESISVMKNEAAIAEYGDKAKDGVIIITTKKNKK